MNKENVEMRKRSGKFDSTDKLTAFFYILMRDHMTPGVVEKIIRDHKILKEDTSQYTNGWLAEYAEDLSQRFKKK